MLSGTETLFALNTNRFSQDLGDLQALFVFALAKSLKSADECQEKIVTFYEDSHLGELGSLE